MSVEGGGPWQGLPRSSGYTQTPDALFDRLMPVVTGAEWKVVCYIVRRTWGFKKDEDRISISQIADGLRRRRDGVYLDHGTGLGETTVKRALKSLIERGVIVAERNSSAEAGFEPTTYRFRYTDESLPPLAQNELRSDMPLAQNELREGVEMDPTLSPCSPPPLGPEWPTQKTDRQETDQETEQQTGPDPAHVWATVKERLAQVLTRPVYETYLADTEAVGLRGVTLLVSAQDDEQRRFLQAKLLPWVLPELQALLGPGAELTVR